jgi:hypothetical protein
MIIKLSDLREVIQIAMGSSGGHLHCFTIRNEQVNRRHIRPQHFNLKAIERDLRNTFNAGK